MTYTGRKLLNFFKRECLNFQGKEWAVLTVRETNKIPKNYWSLEDEALNVLKKKWVAKGYGLVNKNKH